MLDSVSVEQLGLSRAVPYGAAAASLAVLLAMTQVASRGPSAQVAIAGAAIAMPLWLIQATIYEFYLFLGPRAFDHYKSQSAQSMAKGLGYLAGLPLVAAVGGLVHVLLPWAVWAYGLACLVGFYYLHRFNVHLADWWHDQNPPSEAKQ